MAFVVTSEKALAPFPESGNGLGPRDSEVVRVELGCFDTFEWVGEKTSGETPKVRCSVLERTGENENDEKERTRENQHEARTGQSSRLLLCGV